MAQHYSNFIPDVNRFKLAEPPQFFLRRLFEFDDSLVIIPSRQGFYYRLAQRRAPKLTTTIVNEALFKESDTQMMASYHLVPVTTIMASPNWSNPAIIEALRQRSVHRQGGAEVVNAKIEKQEAEDQAKIDAKIDDNLTDLGKDGWGLYGKKIGIRSHMWSPKVKSRDASSPKPKVKSSVKDSGIQVGSIFLP